MDKDSSGDIEEPSTSSNHPNRRGKNHRYRSNYNNSIQRLPRPLMSQPRGRGGGFVYSTNQRGLMHRQTTGNNQRNYVNRHRKMGFIILEDLAKSESREILLKISEKRGAFMDFINSPIDRPDVFSLVIEIIAKVCLSSFETLKLKFIIEICNSQFLVYLQNYLLNLAYETQKMSNKLYWNQQTEFWNNFINFCECITNFSPSTAIRSCRSLIESTSKVCLENLRERHDFKLSDENVMKLNRIRENLTLHEQKLEVQKKKKNYTSCDGEYEPPENFRELSVIPTRNDLLERRPFLRPNIIDGAYHDIEHYLDVQFRLLREDCFGPLRDGIDQYIKEPLRDKYDNIRVFRNVKFVEPYVSDLKSGYVVQLSFKTMKRFKKVNWAHNKRFIYGSLVLFTKDDCKSFIVGTILDRDVKYLTQGKVPIALEDKTIGVNICLAEDTYVMIESEVYFEPYFHVLNSLKDPSFNEHLAMSKYIVKVDPEPKLPGYLTPEIMYTVNSDGDLFDINFLVMENGSWPSNEQLGFNESQYEAYKFALTHEFSVIQGPPGTGKTFLGVKVAATLIENLTSSLNECQLLVICYTNHALDQFLEAILQITPSVARIGGQSRSEVLGCYNIAKLRHEHCARGNAHDLFYTERNTLKTLKGILENAQERVHALNYEVLSYDFVQRYVKEIKILKMFYGHDDPLENWLFENAYTSGGFSVNYSEGEEILNVNEDNHPNKRNEFSYDDLGDVTGQDDDMFEVVTPAFLREISCTFSLQNAIKELEALQATYQKTKDERELEHIYIKMNHLNACINLFRKMSLYRRQAHLIANFQIKDPTQIPTEQRWMIYFSWANIVISKIMTSIIPLQERFVKAATAYEESRMIIDQEILNEKTVIGMTTTGAARLRKLLQSLAPRIVIVEEAAEVLEQHIITSLTKSCQHLILIGDHQQLRPSAAHMKLSKHYNIEVSLFERMIMNKVHSRRLEVQHRMRPEIAALVSPHIYSNLLNHSSVKNLPDVRGISNNVFFLTHNYKEEVIDESSSKSNPQEGDLVLGLANYLVQQDYAPEDVTILSAYSGQMFYMIKQRPLYSHLANVKITVVDNYQGEESKIILLSLVRNNDQNKIGFLGTENRVCVALSRAKEGFYIFGNMDMLRKNSELWEKIAVTLEKSGSLGMSLNLRCENHMENVTKISKVDDFANVPEGGCMLKCSFNLSCGHSCPKVCHGYDRGHSATICTQKCERTLCSYGHICPLMCSVECEPCKEIMNKILPCSHEMPVPCHLEPTDPSVKCLSTINMTLPDCGHEIKKVCYLEMKYVICIVPCIYRVEKCGHECLRTCHITDDPRHEKYICQKPCAKSKQGCTAGLEGDRGDHQCNKKCHETCDPCVVEVDKKRSNCKHFQRVPCNEDVNKTNCKNKCSRSLPCGHFCKKKCFENCGDCKQMVTKVIPDCKHEIKIECMVAPTRSNCTQSCERVLPCEHPCRGMCKDECDPTACTVRTQYTYDSPCGHKVQLPCNIFQLVDNESITEDTYLKHCNEPCMDVLACGHLCQGTCSKCFQGRLHIPCKQKCHQTNICGHLCLEPCNQVCPPCNQSCEVKCQHSQCNKLCGEICAPCQEKCKRACAHGACTRRCGEPCTRAACDAPCPLTLRCEHPCRGLCGEPCPQICNICDPDNFPRGFIGEEYDDDAKFIQLQDCPHIMELEEMDRLMKADQESIAIRTCPFCRKPIINTNRYADLVRKTIVTEINPVKERVYGSTKNIESRKLELEEKFNDFMDKHHIAYSGAFKVILFVTNPYSSVLLSCLLTNAPYKSQDPCEILYVIDSEKTSVVELRSSTTFKSAGNSKDLCLNVMLYPQGQYDHQDIPLWKKSYVKLRSARNKNKNPSLLSLEMLFINLEILEMISNIYKSYRVTGAPKLREILMERILIICQYLYTNNMQKVSQQQQKDIGNELKRLNLIVQLLKIMNHNDFKYVVDHNQEVLQLSVTAKKFLLGWKVFDEERAFQSLQTLQEKIKLSGIIIHKREIELIVKAIGLKAGHWYKCPNGHFYCIGECGGAMEVAKCIECGVAIGGQRHALLSSNSHAPEIDGSKFAAWSEEYNNIENFLLE